MKQANQKLKEYKARDREALLAEAARNSENSKSSPSNHRSNLDAPIASSQKGKQLQSNNDASDA
jgi:hypothetical protein